MDTLSPVNINMIAITPEWRQKISSSLVRHNEDGSQTDCKTEIPAPEIQRLMTKLEKDIELLRNAISELGGRINPILTPEFPKEVSNNDRCKCDTAVGESLQQQIDSVEYLHKMISELIQRVGI